MRLGCDLDLGCGTLDPAFHVPSVSCPCPPTPPTVPLRGPSQGTLEEGNRCMRSSLFCPSPPSWLVLGFASGGRATRGQGPHVQVCGARHGLGLGGRAGGRLKDVRGCCAPEPRSPQIGLVVEVAEIRPTTGKFLFYLLVGLEFSQGGAADPPKPDVQPVPGA